MNLLALTGIVFGIIIIGIFGLGGIGTITACCLRKWKLAKWFGLGTLTAFLLTVAAYTTLIYFFTRPFDPKSPTELAEAYKAEFNVLPPAGVTVLKARTLIVADSGGQWMLLRASPQEIAKHIDYGFTKPQSMPDDFDGNAGANAPKWWAPPVKQLEIYENAEWNLNKDNGWNGRAAMGIDREAGLIWLATDRLY